MDIINKILDFALSETGQLLILALVSLIAGSKYGAHMKVTPKQVEKVLDAASAAKQPGQPLDTKAIAKDVQRQIREKFNPFKK